MAIKDVTARGEWVTFTEVDTMGFTAVVTLSRIELMQLTNAWDAQEMPDKPTDGGIAEDDEEDQEHSAACRCTHCVGTRTA